MKYNYYCSKLNTRVFDIETTGLYANNDRIISASFCNTDGTDLVQYFCDVPQNEAIIIEQIVGELGKADAVVTYNGNMFDIPFVLTRAKKNRVCDRLPLFWSIDVYRWLKKYWPGAQTMESLKQKAVEVFLGLSSDRTDEIGGGECISLYSEYVNLNNEKAKELILLHNGDDVRQLARITQNLSFIDYDRICFEKGFAIRTEEPVLNFQSGKQEYSRIIAVEAKFMKSKISLSAKADPGQIPASIYEDEYHLEYDTITGDINLDIYFQIKDGMHFVDLKKFNVNTDNFRNLAGYDSDFLILKSGNKINYRECNILAGEILKKIL